jgi:murein DD-endopeptidase MepM/ murein hydrolase activator NlpD
MKRRLFVLVLAAGIAATPALGDDVERKREIDAQIAALESSLAGHRADEAALEQEIDAVTTRIRDLEARVGDVSAQLWTLEEDLALHRARLEKLNSLFRLQTARLVLLRKQYRVAIDRLDRRIVAIYVNGRPTMLEFLLGASSIDELLDHVRYVNLIGEQDKAIAAEVAAARETMRRSREQTKKIRRTVRSAQRVIAARAAQVRATRDALAGARDTLAATKSDKLVALSELSGEARAEAEQIDALLATSAALAASIQAAQAASAVGPTSTVSSSGFIWPVSGTLTSGYGWRWGRMHEGVDLAAGSGTPIYASAPGVVIACGYTGGYGNLVVIDHGGGVATAYGHQSSIAVGCGQSVGQGQVIGYVGNTGNSTGPHLHFEVRINGGAVDPLGYL